MGLRLIILIIVVCSTHTAFAAQDKYYFVDANNQQRFNRISQQLRCSFCQNQTIAESDSPHIIDMRAQIFHMVQNGKTDQAIRDFLEYRYGEHVLFDPHWHSSAWLLWLGPLIMLLVASWFCVHLYKCVNN